MESKDWGPGTGPWLLLAALLALPVLLLLMPQAGSAISHFAKVSFCGFFSPKISHGSDCYQILALGVLAHLLS